MASGGATERGIASESPSSLPPSISLDPNDEAASHLMNDWSQIVRGSSLPAQSESDSPFLPEKQNERLHPLHLSPESHPRVSDTAIKKNPPSDAIAVVGKASTISSSDDICSPRVERKQVTHDVAISSPDNVSNESAPLERKPTQQSPVRSPKPAWAKLTNAGLQPGSEPVMGAVAWPALSEARNSKASEAAKASTTQKAASKLSPLSGDRHQSQDPPLLKREVGGNQPMPATMNRKSFNQIMGNGNNLLDSTHTDTSSSSKGGHAIYADQSKRSAKESRTVSSEVHRRGHDITHSFMRDQGRRHYSFPAYGRGYANAKGGNIPTYHQRGGHRNSTQPFVPFVAPNLGFVHPAGFQNVPGSMYYIPAPSSEPILGATHFIAPPVQGVLMHGADLITVQDLVVKQIDYYFSVENLCRDIYLRSKMDEHGFVPVSVIANFNRVRMITQNPFLIIEALRMSNIVEVQGDKVRKKGDWENWLLPASQQSTGSSILVRDGDQIDKFLQSPHKAGGVEDQSNGVCTSKVAVQVGARKSESHLLPEMKDQTVVAEPPQVDVSSFGDERAGDSSVDSMVESKHFSQSCSVESGQNIE